MIAAHAIQITPEVLKLIASIDEFKGAWRALGTLAPDRLSALRRVATIESIGSSTRIEGSKLSDREVERLLSNLQIKSFSTRDEQEVAGYAEIMELVFSSWQDITLTENHIKQLHRDLLTYSEKDAWHRGNYKTSTNSVVAFDEDGKQLGVVFETATPFDTPRLMTELVTWFNEERDAAQFHPLLLIGIWVMVFLEIHPFQDGNGRLSRVLTTLLLLQAGYAYVPYSSLESVIEQSKEAYYLALRQTQGTIRTESPNWQPWLVFFLRALGDQVRRLNRKVEREKIVLAALPELSLQIVEFAREHGRITMGDAIRLPGLFIHDCPREADMSTGLYENFLALIGDLQMTQYPSQALPFQYIVTTTTPPPTQLQDEAVCLVLDPSSDEGLLFGRRFVGERRAALE